jgi:hypothetical protein
MAATSRRQHLSKFRLLTKLSKYNRVFMEFMYYMFTLTHGKKINHQVFFYLPGIRNLTHRFKPLW